MHHVVAGHGYPGSDVAFLHFALVLDAVNKVVLCAGGNIEIGAQGGVLLQPEFIVAFQPVDFAVLKSEIPHGAYHGIIIRHGIHTVILGQAFFQLVRDLVIAGIANAQHIYPVVLEPVTKIPVGFGELRRNKNKVQNILSSLKGAHEKPKPSPVSTNAAEFCVCGRVTICVAFRRALRSKQRCGLPKKTAPYPLRGKVPCESMWV